MDPNRPCIRNHFSSLPKWNQMGIQPSSRSWERNFHYCSFFVTYLTDVSGKQVCLSASYPTRYWTPAGLNISFLKVLQAHKSNIKVLARSGFCQKSPSWLVDDHLHTVTLHDRERQQASLVISLLMRTLILLAQAFALRLSSKLNYFLSVHTVTSGARASMHEFQGDTIQSIAGLKMQSTSQ